MTGTVTASQKFFLITKKLLSKEVKKNLFSNIIACGTNKSIPKIIKPGMINKINPNNIMKNIRILVNSIRRNFFNTNKIDYIFLPYDSKQLNNIRDNYNKTEMEVVFSGRDYVLIKNNYSKIS